MDIPVRGAETISCHVSCGMLGFSVETAVAVMYKKNHDRSVQLSS